MKKIFLLLIVSLSFLSFHKKQLTWVAIGDSITYLNDHQNETGNRLKKGYMTRVVEKLPNIHFINQGHNGWTTGNIAKAIEKLSIVKADIYSVFLGTNDWWHSDRLGTMKDYLNNTGNATTYGAFRTIINKIRSLNSEAKIILITPMQRGDFVYINNPKNNAYGSYRAKSGQTLEQFAKAVDSIGRYEHFEVVDLYHKKGMDVTHAVKFKRLRDPKTGGYKNFVYPHYIDIPFDPEKDEYPYPADAIDVTFDGLHPCDKGCEMISKTLVKIMKKY